jgi:hypothetical protein
MAAHLPILRDLGRDEQAADRVADSPRHHQHYASRIPGNVGAGPRLRGCGARLGRRGSRLDRQLATGCQRQHVSDDRGNRSPLPSGVGIGFRNVHGNLTATEHAVEAAVSWLHEQPSCARTVEHGGSEPIRHATREHGGGNSLPCTPRIAPDDSSIPVSLAMTT